MNYKNKINYILENKQIIYYKNKQIKNKINQQKINNKKNQQKSKNKKNQQKSKNKKNY